MTGQHAPDNSTLWILVALASANLLLTTLALLYGAPARRQTTPERCRDAVPALVRPAPIQPAQCPTVPEIATAVVEALERDDRTAEQDPIKRQVRDLRQNLKEDFQHWRDKARNLRERKAREGDAQ